MDDAQRLARNKEAVGQLVASVAHDFNNVLMVLESSLSLLDHPLDDDMRRRVLDGMRRAVKQGGELTRRMRKFAAPALRENRVVDLAEQLLAMGRRIAGSLGEATRLDVRCDTGLPNVRANAEDLELALLNLCRNAEDAMPQGGTIRVDARCVGDGVCIAVSDSGAGMTQEIGDRAFEPFFTTKRGDSLGGLGLAQVYCFVLRSDGSVRIESESGRGTTVRMELPRA